MARDGFDGLGKMRGGERPSSYIPKPHDHAANKKQDSEEGGDAGGVKVHEVHEHPDGHMETHMHDGTSTEHPDHLHMLAHLGHHITGGDKHHVVHHDGMSAKSHSIHEDGQHEEHGEHNSAEEARQALDTFLGEEAQESAHQHGGGEEEEEGPVMGGM